MSRAQIKRKQQNRGAVFSVAIIVVILLVVLGVRCVQLYAKDLQYQHKEDALNAQLESEQQRSQEIEDYEEYSQTDDYVVDIARTKLGLVFKGEKIFRQADTADK